MVSARALPDHVRFMIWVLWMHGYSMADVSTIIYVATGKTVDLTRFQIRSVLDGTPYQARQTMSRDERQRHLDHLERHRLDGGVLKDHVFIASSIWGEK